jgi:HlyD family secretion protein
MKKRIVWIVGLVVVIAAGTWGGFQFFNKKDTQLKPSFVTTQVRKGTIEVKISGTGSIQPSDRQTLKANTTGTVNKVNFKQGDTVKKGDILITYKQEDVSNKISSKNIDIKKMKLELTDLQTKYKEASDDAARATLMLNIQKQELDILTAEGDLTTLQTDNSIDPIVAPIDGVLATFDVQAGDSINPNSTLGEVVNFAQLQMVVGIDELDIPKVKLNQEAQILVEALPNDTFTGKVITIANEGTTSNGVASFDVTINLAKSTHLKVGMSAEASIMTDKKTDALYVPVEAVQSFQGKYFVMIPSTGTSTAGQAAGANAGANVGTAPQSGQGQAGQGQARQGQGGQGQGGQRLGGQGQRGANRGTGGPGASANAAGTTRIAVEVGINNENNIEIISGLKEGDSVVLPTVVSSSSKSNAQTGFPGLGGGGIPGAGGGFPGGGGGFQGGGAARGGTRG